MTEPRLDRATLGLARVAPPSMGPDGLDIGIVHLGMGAFHRAHQAVFTQDAVAATTDHRWGILGVTMRSRGVVEQLEPQNGLYGVLERGEDSTDIRHIGVVRRVVFMGDATDEVIEVIAAPTTHIVSLTVTERGYRTAPDGALDLDDLDVRADVAALATQLDGARDTPPARTPIGLLARGIAARARAPHVVGGLTIVCCDNMVGNGRVVESLVRACLEAAATQAHAPADDVRRWLDARAAFPSSMVDRIVPATTAADRTEAGRRTAVRDAGLVVAEPFRQWVIEDRFAGPRPAWERGGAIVTDDVGPFELAKLRMLNGTHSLLAYLGALDDHELISDAVRDDELARAARGFLDEDVIPTLRAPRGFDLAAYADSLLIRFANPNIEHQIAQIATDGSKKIPMRIVDTIVERRAAGHDARWATRALAGWIAFVARGRSRSGKPLELADPRAAELATATGRGASEPWHAERIVAGVCALDGIVPPALAADDAFIGRLIDELDHLLRARARGILNETGR